MAEQTEKSLSPRPAGNWTNGRKLSLAGVALLCVIFFAVIIIQARTADYSLLFANLSSSDAGGVVEWLKGQKIPYRLQDSGQAIYIPADQVYDARLQLAGSGLPQGGGVGFEIFDRQSFGMTDFAQKVNYRRALQGELARTISSLAPVETARVHLALPEKRLFKAQQQEPTASVIIKLSNGRRLTEPQIEGIIHLVAGSIEGLESDLVTVVNANGKILSGATGDNQDASTTPGMLNFQTSLENRLGQRAQALLDRALGAGNSLVQVTAKVDFTQRERLEEIYDPNRTAVVSEQVSEEKSGRQGSGGVPGVQANLEGGGTSTNSTPTSRTDETTNYEVSKIVNKQVDPVGVIESVSVAVLVADKAAPAIDGKEPEFQPRTSEELAAIEKMITSALGLDNERGDRINVTSMPFVNDLLDQPLPAPSATERINDFLPLVRYLLLALGALLLYLVLVRPMLKSLRQTGSAPQAQYKTVEALENEISGEKPAQLGMTKDPAERLRQQLMQSQSSPTQVVKAWLQES